MATASDEIWASRLAGLPANERLVKIRTWRGLTQEAVARRTGWHVNQVRGIEKGRIRIDKFSTVVKLAGAYDVSPTTIIEGLPEFRGNLERQVRIGKLAEMILDLARRILESEPSVTMDQAWDLIAYERYEILGNKLFALARDVEGIAWERRRTGERRNGATRLLIDLYIRVAEAMAEAGVRTLCGEATEACLRVGRERREPEMAADGVHRLVETFLRLGRFREAEEIARRAAHDLDGRIAAERSTLVRAVLWLDAGMAGKRLGAGWADEAKAALLKANAIGFQLAPLDDVIDDGRLLLFVVRSAAELGLVEEAEERAQQTPPEWRIPPVVTALLDLELARLLPTSHLRALRLAIVGRHWWADLRDEWRFHEAVRDAAAADSSPCIWGLARRLGLQQTDTKDVGSVVSP